MKIASCITELIGNTPLLRLCRTTEGLDAHVLAKLEYFNPASSVKDRAALNMIVRAEEAGRLRRGGTIVEPTSGNTGIGIALVAMTRGYRVVLTMPESMSEERKRLLRGLGARLVLTPPAEGMTGAIAEAERILDSTPGAVMLSQFENPANPEAHFLGTAEEIWRDTDGRVDVFVSAVGTGGTVSGVGRRLKEHRPEIEIVAVEPLESSVISGGGAGPHPIQGIGAGFIPRNLDLSVVDKTLAVSGQDAIETARRLIREEGIFCGISAGAAAAAALKLASQPAYRGKTIVFIAPDTADRYLSTALFEQE